MVIICAVFGCQNGNRKTKQSKHIAYHRIPIAKDDLSKEIREQWISYCKLSKGFNPENGRVCSIHFTEDDYKRDLQNEMLGLPQKRILKNTAIPSQNLCYTNSTKTRRKQNLINKKNSMQQDTPVISSTENASAYQEPRDALVSPPQPLQEYSSIRKLSMGSSECNISKTDAPTTATTNAETTLIIEKPRQTPQEQNIHLKDNSSQLYIADLTLPVPNYIPLENSFENAVQQELSEDLIDVKTVPITVVSLQICRLCLVENPEMWLFSSVLTFEDQTTLDIGQAFQELTGESTEQIESPRLPKYICSVCIDLLVNAYSFRQKYEKSKITLNQFLSKNDLDEMPIVDVKSCKNNVEVAELETYKNIMFKEETDDDNFLECLDVKIEELAKEPLETAKKIDHLNETHTAPEEIKTESDEKVMVVEEEPVIKLHRCPICFKKFKALELREHCRSHKSLKSYLNLAPKFNKKVRFYAQPRTKNTCWFYRENLTHSCPFCTEEFSADKFTEHIIQHRLEQNFRCNICNRIFIGRNHLKMHQLSHKREAPYRCEECRKNFFQQKNYDFHMLGHTKTGDLPFKCQYCERSFSNPEHLKRHTFTHEKSMSYQQYYKRSRKYVNCRQCLQKFKTREEMEQHNCKLSCSKCHKIFEKKKEFNAHVCTYKLQGMQCDPCGKVFQLSSSYKQHRYRCNYKTLCYVCGKHVSNIQQHLYTHYPHRRKFYTCAECGKQFRYPVNLKNHVAQVHSVEVPYHCQYCAKGFKNKWNLTVHERIHVGVKKHACNFCDMAFLERSYLQRHMKVHRKKEGIVLDNVEEDSS